MRFTIVITTIILSLTGFAVCRTHESSHHRHSHSTSSFQTSMKAHPSLSPEAVKDRKIYVGNLTLYPAVTHHGGHHRASKNKKLDVLNVRMGKQLSSLILNSERWKVAYESGPPKLMIPALCGLMTTMERTKKEYLKNAAAWNQTITKRKSGKKARIDTMQTTISWPTTATLKQCKLA